MTSIENERSALRKFDGLDVFVTTGFVFLGTIGLLWGVHLNRIGDSFSGGQYLIWSLFPLVVASVRLFAHRRSLGVHSIAVSVFILGWAIEKWLRGRSIHALGILLLLTACGLFTLSVRSIREQKRLASGESIPLEGGQQARKTP
jgi:hypothetical protein